MNSDQVKDYSDAITHSTLPNLERVHCFDSWNSISHFKVTH